MLAGTLSLKRVQWAALPKMHLLLPVPRILQVIVGPMVKEHPTSQPLTPLSNNLLCNFPRSVYFVPSAIKCGCEVVFGLSLFGLCPPPITFNSVATTMCFILLWCCDLISEM